LWRYRNMIPATKFFLWHGSARTSAHGSILDQILSPIQSFPQRLKSVRIISFAFLLAGSTQKRRTEEHRLVIASFRRRKDFLKACSNASPSASNVF
jgi:hypothetical protein